MQIIYYGWAMSQYLPYDDIKFVNAQSSIDVIIRRYIKYSR